MVRLQLCLTLRMVQSRDAPIAVQYILLHDVWHVAFKDCYLGVQIQFWTDGSIFNLRRLQAQPMVHTAILHDLLFADDCALQAPSQDVAQQLLDCFASAAHRFFISLKKTVVMLQLENLQSYTTPAIRAYDTCSVVCCTH